MCACVFLGVHMSVQGEGDSRGGHSGSHAVEEPVFQKGELNEELPGGGWRGGGGGICI